VSRGRHRRYPREAEPPPGWPLAIAFWLPIVVSVGYLARAHRAHAWGALQWLLLVIVAIASVRRVLHWRWRIRIARPPHDAAPRARVDRR